MHLRPGQIVGHYEVVREIARGGQGVVCEARDTVRGGLVALKLLLDTDPDALARFQREGRTLQRLDHPHLIQVQDVGELPGGLPYMAMELVRGQHLKEWVRREGLPSRKGVVDLLHRVAEALHYCHEQGLIHRDIKPENILLEDGTGRVVIVDFGLVRRRKLELAWSTQDQASLTEDGSILGTPAYMAPEQVSPELGEVDRRTDVYALGGLLFFLLTGQPPFVGAGSWGLLVSVLSTPARDPREVRPDLPEPLAAFCLACLKKSPGDRPPSARVFADELRGRVGGARRSGLGRLLVALVGALIVGVGLWAALGRSVEPSEPAAAPSPTQSRLPTPRGQASTSALARGEALWASDPAEAIVWFERAAEQGSTVAMRRLAGAYTKGEGVLQDYPRAIAWYRRAAAQGDALAIRSLGVHYGSGVGVEVDLELAGHYFQRAAELGDTGAMRTWGTMLLEGQGTPRDPVAGRTWILRSAEAGDQKSMVVLGSLLLEGVGGDPSPEEAVRWFRRAAGQGFPSAMRCLGFCYENGRGVREDRAHAARWFERGAKSGDVASMTQHAHGLRLGLVKEKDPQAAVAWYEKAAAGGDAEAMRNLAAMFALGAGVTKDLERSIGWARRAAEQGGVAAMKSLGRALALGDPAVRDPVEAATWLRRARQASTSAAERAEIDRWLEQLEAKR